MGILSKYKRSRRVGTDAADETIRFQESESPDSLFDCIPDMLVWVTADGWIRDVNRAFERRLGYSREESVGKKITFFSPEALPGGIYQIYKDNGGQIPVRFNLVLQSRDQNLVYTDVSTVKTVREGVEAVLVCMRDVGTVRAEAVAAERRVIYGRALKELAALQPKVTLQSFDPAVDALLKKVGDVAGADRVYLFQCGDNEAFFTNTHEWCAEGVLSVKNRLQRIPAGTLPWWVSRLRKRQVIVLDDLASLPAEASAERAVFERDGVCSLLAAPIFEEGRLLGFAGMDSVGHQRTWNEEDQWLLRKVSDILWGMLANIRTEGVLEPTHFEFEQALFSAGVGLWTWNLDSGTVRYSSHWCRMIGYEPYEADSQIGFFKRRIHKEEFDQVIATISRCVQGYTDEYECEFRMACKGGGWIWVLSKGRGLAKGSDGLPRRIIGTHLDITRHKEALLQIQHARSLSEKITLARNEFLSTVSHELRTPMTGIIGMSQLLRYETDCPKQIEMADSILECSGQMMQLIDNLLDIADLQTANLKINNREFDPHKVLSDVSEFFAAQAASKKIELISAVSPRLPLRVIHDEGRIRQILTALVDNAIKFTPSGTVSLRASFRAVSPREGILTIGIRDSGIGIPAHRQKDIFEPFIQVDGSPCRVFGGAGLGLTRVKKLVDLMCGEISVRSVEGKGSVFSVKIPVKLPQDYVLTLAPAPSALIAEDNPWNRVVLEKMLENAGWRTEVVFNGVDAVEKISRVRYDLVFMDVEMPVLSGLDATRMIRSKEREEGLPRSVICAVTAYALPGDREKYLAAGMDEYLAKPLRIKDLDAVIQKYRKT